MWGLWKKEHCGVSGFCPPLQPSKLASFLTHLPGQVLFHPTLHATVLNQTHTGVSNSA